MPSHRSLAGRLQYEGFRAAFRIIPRLPAPIAYGLAAPAGTIVWAFSRRRSDVAHNLSHVLGANAAPGRLARLTLQVHQNIVRYYVDLLRSPMVDVYCLEREHTIYPGYGHLLAAIAEGKGVILVTIHFGCVEIALQATRARGLTFFALAEPLRPPELSDLFLRIRSGQGHQFMPVGLAGMKAALRRLRRGGIVLLLVDRDIQGSGVEVPFFGSPASLPTGAVDLARLTGASIVPAVARRLAGGMAEISVEPAVELVASADRERDRHENVRRVIQRFEPHIRRNPEQWLVLQRIWRS